MQEVLHVVRTDIIVVLIMTDIHQDEAVAEEVVPETSTYTCIFKNGTVMEN